MKYYLFLLLLVFIACDVEKQTDEIILKDYGHDFLDAVADIIEECGIEDDDCITDKFTQLYLNLTPDQALELQQFVLSPECQPDCVEALKDAVKDESLTDVYCNYICGGN